MLRSSENRLFENRQQAAQALLEELRKLSIQNPLVLALPRGGVVLGKIIADAYHVPTDILLVRKIGAPFNPELALGAVVEGDPYFKTFNRELIRVLKIEKSYLDSETEKQIQEIERRKKLFCQGKVRPSASGRTVIVVDDGVATGASVRAVLQVIRSERPEQLILAIPVAPHDLVDELRREVDTLLCLLQPEGFVAVGQFYRDFPQVTDEEVQRILN